jgi:hypothetical protein
MTGEQEQFKVQSCSILSLPSNQIWLTFLKKEIEASEMTIHSVCMSLPISFESISRFL